MGARYKYQWDKWLSQPRIRLVRGVDYRCSQSAMATQIRNNASQRGLRVRVLDDNDSIMIEVLGEARHTDKVALPR